jgi:hypothetical protein
MRQWYAPVDLIASLVSVMGVLLLAGGQALAQTPPAPNAGGLFGAPSGEDEIAPRLQRGPGSEVLRLWQHTADLRKGGAGVLVASALPGDRWETVLDLRPQEKGVSTQEGNLAVAPSGEGAVAYQWWQDNPRSKQIRVATSDVAGKRWNLSATALDSAGKAFEPKVAWTNGKGLVVVWSDERRGRRLFDVYVRRSPDGGKTWEPEQLLSRFPHNLPGDIHARPRLLSDGKGRLWAVWVGVRSGRSAVYLNRSLDGGETWSEPQALTGDSRSVFAHTLVGVGDRLLMVWHDTRTGRDRLYAVTSGDAGVTWTEPTRVDHLPDASPVDAAEPTVVLGADGEALVAWQDGRNGRNDVFLSRSSDWGRTWPGEDQRMDMDEAGTAMSRYPKLARAADGRVALAWEDDRDGHEGIYARVRPPGTSSAWGPEVVVARPTPKQAARLPEVLWGRDGLYVAWETWDYTAGIAASTKKVAGRMLTNVGR